MRTIRTTFWTLTLTAALGAVTVGLSGEQQKGAEQIILDGGKSGIVGFPHSRHQTFLTDCNTCHELYPQQPGIIAALKQQGTLNKKQVMNKQCIACHKKQRLAGDKAGPTTCKSCHTK